MRWQRALRDAERAATVALALGLAAQLGTSVFPYGVRAEWVLSGGLLAFLALLLVSALVRRPPWDEAASSLDRACGLEDRLATWLAVVRGQATGALVDHFLRDVESTAARVRVKEAVAIGRPRLRAVAALALASVLWEVLLSGVTLPGTPARRVAEVVRREGRRLEAVGQAWEERSRARGLLEAERTAQALAAAGQRLAGPRASAAGALRDLAAVQQGIEAERRPFRSALERAGLADGLGPPALRPWVGTVDRELRRIASAVEEAELSPQRAEAIRRALRTLDTTAPLRSDAPARRALQEAARRVGSGDAAGAREAVRQAEEALRELQRMLEAEGALAAQQREAEASSAHIATALRTGTDPEAAVERPHTYPTGPRDTTRSSSGVREDPEAQAWLGPDQGLQPGSGSVRDQLGPPSPRLPGQRRPEVLRGQVGEGRVYTTQVVAPAATTRPQTPLARVPVRAVRQVDEALVRDRVPARYRDWVRRYFLGLGSP
jgi:hypothetical protein